MKHLKFKLLILALMVSNGPVLLGQESRSSVSELILSSYSSKVFNTVPVSEDQIQLVLRSGIRAPSARNSQTWKFTVVRDSSLAKEIIRDALPGNVVIVISGPESDAQGMNADIDCALATAFMYIAAQSLGLGTHLYTGPVSSINENFMEELEIQEGYRAIIAMKIGNIHDAVDGVSSASSRKDLKEFVTFK